MSEQIKELVKRLRERRDRLVLVSGIQVAMKDQMHLDAGRERDYWHYGYAVALDDALRMLGEEDDDAPIH